MKCSRKNLIFALVFLILFVLIEFVCTTRLDSISPYASYFAEIIWIFCVFIALRRVEWKKSSQILFPLAVTVGTGILGAFANFYAARVGIVIPFNYESSEVLLFLLFIGPILEEFVFRGALWRVLEELKIHRALVAIFTTIIFSVAHLYEYLSVPEAYQPFVIYQGAYTLVLGMACAYLRMGFGLRFAMLAHLFFNAGFWLAR